MSTVVLLWGSVKCEIWILDWAMDTWHRDGIPVLLTCCQYTRVAQHVYKTTTVAKRSTCNDYSEATSSRDDDVHVA